MRVFSSITYLLNLRLRRKARGVFEDPVYNQATLFA